MLVTGAQTLQQLVHASLQAFVIGSKIEPPMATLRAAESITTNRKKVTVTYRPATNTRAVALAGMDLTGNV